VKDNLTVQQRRNLRQGAKARDTGGVIVVIKGENWTLAAGFRARHGRVLLFDPTNSKSAACNPLLEVRRGE
jgi:type IV secretory pathway TraG/TraD family ATPase VirD4